MKTFAAWLALAFAVFLAVAEVTRNSGVVQWWPFWVVDYIAVGLLLWGAAAVLWTPSANRGGAILTAGWGFATAMFWMSFFGHLGEVMRSGVEIDITNAQSAVDEPWLTVIIGVLFATTVVGLVTSLIGEMRRAAPES
jgi:hypothetical protein